MEVSWCARIWRLCEEGVQEDLIHSEPMRRVPLEKVLEQIVAAAGEPSESFSHIVVLLSTHLQQVVTVFKLEEIAPVVAVLWLTDEIADLQILINLVLAWKYGSAFVEQFCKDASYCPDITRLAVLTAPEQDLGCAVP